MTASQSPEAPTTNWNAKKYQSKHSFVWELGTDLINVLDPREGEVILDIGCGTGELTAAIADRGAVVRGIDADSDMILEARKQFSTKNIEFHVDDARTFEVPQPLDAIFSNAALHWVQPAEQAVQSMSRALRPGGRLVAELGGKGNVAKIVDALELVMCGPPDADSNDGMAPDDDHKLNLCPWYFPTIGEYTSLLESNGFEVSFATLVDRPTPLEDGEKGMANWLTVFAGPGGYFEGKPAEEVREIVEKVDELLRPSLYNDEEEKWVADYRRLRVVATKLL